MKRSLAVLAVVGVVAGCGGHSTAKTPSEDPTAVMTRLVRFELAGSLDSSYKMLVREQRAVVDRELYVSCPAGPPIQDADIVVLGVRDEAIDVPAIGRTNTKAVTWQLTMHPLGSAPFKLSHTGHLIAQDGEWRWTLSAKSFASFKAGVCP